MENEQFFGENHTPNPNPDHCGGTPISREFGIELPRKPAKPEMHVEIPISEYSALHRRIGYMEGVLETLEKVALYEDRESLLDTLQRTKKRYAEIKSLGIIS